MLKTLVLSLLALVCVSLCSTAARAEEPDDIQFSNLSCQQFISGLQEMDEESAGYVMMWLDGYLSGITNDTLLHWDGLETFGADLASFCQKNPRSGLLDAAKAIGIKR